MTSDSALLLARHYNDAESGTYGVALPVFADDRLVSAGDTVESTWSGQLANGIGQ